MEAKYDQILDMVWYRALPEGLPLRLYEYLTKNLFQQKNSVFRISEEALCRWLPIIDKNVTKRRARIKKIANDLVAAGFLISYKFDSDKKLCIFRYAKPSKPPE